MSRCVACNSPLTYRKKRPITVFSGQMNSQYTDALSIPDKIPKGEYEDLCDTCINEIKYYNFDMTDHNVGIVQRQDKEFYMETDEAFEDNTLSGEFEITEDFYQGYRDTGL